LQKFPPFPETPLSNTLEFNALNVSVGLTDMAASESVSIARRADSALRAYATGRDSLPNPTNGKVMRMTWAKLTGTIAAGAVVVAAASNLALAQQVAPEGRVYVFNSPKTGPCPELDWHVVVGPNNTLSGMVGWNAMKSMASVSGSISPDRTFKMQGKEVGGQGRTANITGQLRGDGWLIANIKGPTIDCKGIAVPWFVSPPPASG
jgi:hypothetical protein